MVADGARPFARPFARIADPRWIAAAIAYLKDVDKLAQARRRPGQQDQRGDQEEDKSEKKWKKPKGKGKGEEAPNKECIASNARAQCWAWRRCGSLFECLVPFANS